MWTLTSSVSCHAAVCAYFLHAHLLVYGFLLCRLLIQHAEQIHRPGFNSTPFFSGRSCAHLLHDFKKPGCLDGTGVSFFGAECVSHSDPLIR